MSNAGMRPTILIVDDEWQLREMLSEILTPDGYNVEIATNGQEAITILQTVPVKTRIMLLDLFMPIVDGWGVVRWVVEHPDVKTQTKIVLMSANERLMTANDVEHDAELAKPFGIDPLLAVLKRLS